MPRPDSGSEDGHKSAPKEVGLLNLAHQVTEEEHTQRRRTAINPIPQSSPESSFCFVSDGVLKRGEKVFLNVYNLGGINPYLRACLCCGSGGLAIYHSAIEVYGIEYAFGGHPTSSSGVFETKPFHQLIENGVLPDNISLHEQHYLGVTSKSPLKIADVVAALAPAWPGNGYDLIRRNCNHFATELAEALKLRPACAIPAHVNRIARVATAISCCLPKSIKDTVSWTSSSRLSVLPCLPLRLPLSCLFAHLSTRQQHFHQSSCLTSLSFTEVSARLLPFLPPGLVGLR